MAVKSVKPISDHDDAFWRAYLEILGDRAPLVDRWRDGSQTWHPRVIQKLLWYSDVPHTPQNRMLAYEWLMRNATRSIRHMIHLQT